MSEIKTINAAMSSLMTLFVEEQRKQNCFFELDQKNKAVKILGTLNRGLMNKWLADNPAWSCVAVAGGWVVSRVNGK